jgi:hypothetical protein
MRAERPPRNHALLSVLISVLAVFPCLGGGPAELSRGQTIYIPVYSHIYHGTKAKPFNLACTLSIRNTDVRSAITVIAAEYYDTAGKLIRKYTEKPARVAPLGTLEYYIEERDTKGGSGANFIVHWTSETLVNPPLAEAVMIGVESAQGISFTSRGVALAEHP